MKNFFVELLIIGLLACGSVNAQQSDMLLRADSLIQSKNYTAAEGILLRMIEDNPSRFELAKAYFLLSRSYFGNGDLGKATYNNQKSLSIFKDLHYEFIAENYFLFGLIEMQKGDNEMALGNFLKASELPFESIEFAGLVYAYIAQVNYRKGDVENVLINYQIAMEALMTAFVESNKLDLNHYKIRGNRLWYDNFLVGYL